MKNTIKFLGIIALVAVIGFTACSNGSGGGGSTGGGGSGGGGGNGVSSKSFEVTANASGVIDIQYNGGDGDLPPTVTTDLPAPYDKFTLNTVGETKTISGLTANQKVTGKVSWSGNFARVDVYENTVYIQTYKN
jgi:hypothetical protein